MKWSIYLMVVCGICTGIIRCTSASKQNPDVDSATGKTAGWAKDMTLETPDYVAYVEDPDNGLCKVKEIGDMVYTLQYKPLEYVVALECHKDTIAGKELKQRVGELKDMQYFTLKIEAKDHPEELLRYKLETPEQYFERIQYFSFGMQHDIYLKDGQDSIPCALFHFERNYGIAPYASFVLGFPASGSRDMTDKTFSFVDKVFDGGTINMRMDKSQLSTIPKLKTY